MVQTFARSDSLPSEIPHPCGGGGVVDAGGAEMEGMGGSIGLSTRQEFPLPQTPRKNSYLTGWDLKKLSQSIFGLGF